MSVTLPLRNDLTDFSFTTQLDNASYSFRFWWNERSTSWFMTISDEAGNIFSNVPLVVDFPLGTRNRSTRMPPGRLIAQDLTGARQNPGLNDLGTRVVLLYFGVDEL